MDIKELSLVNPDQHWYYQSKLFALRRVLNRYKPDARSFIDVGAGSGFFARNLADFEAGDQAICVDPNYSKESQEFEGALRFTRTPPAQAADAYLLIDVLEHVPDEYELLRPYLASAQPGAIFVATVPAFMSMWSAHDVFLEHYRRYTLRSISQVFMESQLTVVHGRYLFGSVFPAAWFVRRLQRNSSANSSMKPLPQPLNAVLKRLVKAEHRCSSNRLAGISALVVAVQP